MKPQAPDPRPALFPPAIPPFDARQAALAVRGQLVAGREASGNRFDQDATI